MTEGLKLRFQTVCLRSGVDLLLHVLLTLHQIRDRLSRVVHMGLDHLDSINGGNIGLLEGAQIGTVEEELRLSNRSHYNMPHSHRRACYHHDSSESSEPHPA